MAGNREPNAVGYDFTVPAGKPWSRVVRKGEVLRIIDSEGCQAVDTLFYKAGDASERYSAQDTVREQGSPYITTGTKLLSNEGNVMAVIVADTSGGHDTSAGACSAEANTVRFGHDTKFMHSCRDNFVSELARHGLTKRDLVSNINFFMNVPIEPNGTLAIVDGVSKPGDYVELRAEMDILVVISNCPQVNNPCNDFNPTSIRTVIWNG